MSSSPALASHFLSHVRPEARSHVSPSVLETVLGESLARARAAWPQVRLEAGVFAGYLGVRLPPGAKPERLLRTMHAGDLFLTAACVRGEAAAQAALEIHFLLKYRHPSNNRASGYIAPMALVVAP